MNRKKSVKNDLKQYFTDAPEINIVMANLLGNVNKLNILEPSVGSGSLFNNLNGIPISIDAIDIDKSILKSIKTTFPSLPLKTHHLDFIDLFLMNDISKSVSFMRNKYDAVISNPPYGLKFSIDYRKKLKKAFSYLYVRESYGLFFAFSLMLLKDNGRYVFLLPDTFINSIYHKPLRQFIVNYGDPTHIIRFSSDRFKTVNFKYGNLCIIAGHKRPISKLSKTIWIEAFDKCYTILNQPENMITTINGEVLKKNVKEGWHYNIENTHIIDNWTTLGEIAECKTGIYTGDNCSFIGYDYSRLKKHNNGHHINWENVYKNQLSQQQRQNGLDGKFLYVPFIRGGHKKFAEKTAWAILWDKKTVQFYKNNKKSRFQNSSYYFRDGIAVPKIISKQLSASLMDNSVFDQGVVGVFPKKLYQRDAILLYLNSSKANNLRNQIVNGSANCSANYLKRLPTPIFCKNDCKKAKDIVKKALKNNNLSTSICDDFVKTFINQQNN